MANQRRVSDRLYTLLAKVDKENPKPATLAELRKLLGQKKNPIIAHISNQAIRICSNMINTMETSESYKELLRAAYKKYFDELGIEDATGIPRIMLEQILTSWLRVEICEYYYTGALQEKTPVHAAKFWQETLNVAHQRLNRSIDAYTNFSKKIGVHNNRTLVS